VIGVCQLKGIKEKGGDTCEGGVLVSFSSFITTGRCEDDEAGGGNKEKNHSEVVFCLEVN